MHVLELTDSELHVLRDTAKARAREVEEELVHTDDRSFRAGLRKDLECLEALERKLVAIDRSDGEIER